MVKTAATSYDTSQTGYLANILPTPRRLSRSVLVARRAVEPVCLDEYPGETIAACRPFLLSRLRQT